MVSNALATTGRPGRTGPLADHTSIMPSSDSVGVGVAVGVAVGVGVGVGVIDARVGVGVVVPFAVGDLDEFPPMIVGVGVGVTAPAVSPPLGVSRAVWTSRGVGDGVAGAFPAGPD